MNRFSPFDRWLTLHESTNPTERLEAVHRAPELGAAQVEDRLRPMALADPEASVRLAALQTLISFGDEGLGRTLRAAVLDPDAAIRRTAAEALSRYPCEETAAALASRAGDEAEVAEAAFRALAAIGDDWALSQLSALAASGVAARQLDAIGALAASRNPAAVPRLALNLHSPDVRIRAAAVAALGSIGPSVPYGVPCGTLLDTLLNSLDDPAADVRLAAAAALESVKAWEAYPALNAALGDEEPQVREIAERTLSRLEAPRHARMALLAFQLSSPTMRARAIRRLASLGDSGGHSGIAASLGDEDGGVRHTAAEALRQLQLEPYPNLLREALESEVGRLRAGAIRNLAERRDHASTPRFLKALDDPDLSVRVSAAQALGLLRADEACPVLCDRLQDPSPEFREAAIGALGEVGCRQALYYLRERLHTFGGEPVGRLRKLLRAAMRSIEERTDHHAHLPIAAAPPQLDDTCLPLSTDTGKLTTGLAESLGTPARFRAIVRDETPSSRENSAAEPGRTTSTDHVN